MLAVSLPRSEALGCSLERDLAFSQDGLVAVMAESRRELAHERGSGSFVGRLGLSEALEEAPQCGGVRGTNKLHSLLLSRPRLR